MASRTPLFDRGIMEVLYKDKHVIAINKPVGIGSQPDKTGGADVMSELIEYLRENAESDKLWLVHRLDRVVGGVLVYARDKEYASKLSALFSSDGAEKEYFAIVDGVQEGGRLTDLLYKDARVGKAFVVDKERRGVKVAELMCVPISSVTSENGQIKTLVKVTLKTGRFHQIRAQISSRKTPITGDGKYGSRDNRAKTPALFATRVSFEVNGRLYEFSHLPPITEYPWSLFDKSVYTV